MARFSICWTLSVVCFFRKKKKVIFKCNFHVCIFCLSTCIICLFLNIPNKWTTLFLQREWRHLSTLASVAIRLVPCPQVSYHEERELSENTFWQLKKSSGITHHVSLLWQGTQYAVNYRYISSPPRFNNSLCHNKNDTSTNIKFR